MNHLLHSLWRNANEYPNKDIYVHLDRNAETFRRMGFRTLYRLVCVISRHLSGITRANDRVLLLYENAFDFIPVFLACMHHGCIPASIQIPNGKSKINRIREIITQENIAAIILPDTLNEKGWFKKLMDQAEDIHEKLVPIADSWGGLTLDEYPEPAPFKGDRIIYGQLSSGTTGRSKWINITSDNVKANTDAIGISIKQCPDWNHLCWLPHYHDLGLVAGLFLSICHGNTTWLIDPLDFVGRPHVWLEAIHRYRINFTHAPNFALDLCVRRIGVSQMTDDLDLSTVTSIMVCAEPIRPKSLENFHNLFRPYGLGPKPFVTCFGMAECTLAATMQEQKTAYKIKYHPLLERTFVSCGVPVEGTGITIMPLEGQPDDVGEVVIHGPSVSPDHAETGLQTGDIGFLYEGELYICGRIKEVIILNGLKHSLHEIEDVTETLSFIHDRGVLACARQDEDKETLELFVELRRDALQKNLRNEQRSSITRILNREFGITPGAIHFFPPACLPKTSSGKKIRQSISSIKTEIKIKELI
jgi:acyl-CoA synthetase (AMP-forming)/AMP-acid ligase II